jgi:hypothetical protein
MAFTLAFGQQHCVDAAFLATMLLFVFLGVYWLGRYAVLFRHSPAWGLAFLLAPGTLAGLERAAIDTALVALTIGFALYLREQSRYRLLTILVMAGRAGRLGLLILACAGSALLRQRWRCLALSCVSALPALAWYAFVQLRSPAEHNPSLMRVPLTDLLRNVMHHNVGYVKSGAWLVQLLYYVAVLGTLLAIAFAIRLSFNQWKNAEVLAMLGFALVGRLLQPPGLWIQPYHFGRILAPLTVLLALGYFTTGDWRECVPPLWSRRESCWSPWRRTSHRASRGIAAGWHRGYRELSRPEVTHRPPTGVFLVH